MGYKKKSDLKDTRNDQKAAIMRPTDVALYCNISVNTVWRWVRIGHLPPPTRIGARFSFWRREQIENLVMPGTK